MEGEDITEAESRFLDDLRRRIVRPADGPVEPVDQRIKLFGRDLVEASKVGHDARADLAAVVSKGPDKLQVLEMRVCILLRLYHAESHFFNA
jgi:hypothetical protein